ncbi:hypothetical protein EZV62_019516 [Acer yangbiense]|uniref:RING-type E3 ubiquitin transferase n=1 Tax=Acer yangbiense TaxID=1000413 RepID=A0A5C7HB36_9ROSI|nr:hypothetical protein EZV62_019516 [Acer yangbiense]
MTMKIAFLFHVKVDSSLLGMEVSTSSLGSSASDEEEKEDVCRNPADADNPLWYPCAYSGSIKFVHLHCLAHWLNHRKTRQCEVCRHAFSFYPVYAENAPARLPFQEFIVGMATKACHVLQFYLRLSFVLLVWLLLIPFITFWIWRLAFVRSFREAQISFLSHISTTVILTDCLHGFLLSASIFLIFLVVAHMRSNSAPAAPPEQANRNIAGEDAGGIHGIAGLDDADGAEDVHEHTHFDELFGMQGPVFCSVKNPSIMRAA